VLVADDHRVVLDHVVRLLSGDCEVVGAVQSGRDLLEMAVELDPDIVVLDISMPGMSGIEAAGALRRAPNCPRILFLSNHCEEAVVRAARESGASGYVPKPRAAEELVPALQAVASGETYFSPSVTPPVPTPK
jgi:DNA-binding NarL/FixJ family response regulator